MGKGEGWGKGEGTGLGQEGENGEWKGGLCGSCSPCGTCKFENIVCCQQCSRFLTLPASITKLLDCKSHLPYYELVSKHKPIKSIG